MGWGSPKVEEINRAGKIVYRIRCNESKCPSREITGNRESAVKSEYRKHLAKHKAVKAGKKTLEKAKSKVRGKGECDICGKTPCAMKKRACIRENVGSMPSSMDIDITDPATFNKQMRDWT